MSKPKPRPRFRNISPLGALDVPALGTIIDAGEVFEVSEEIAALLAEQPEHYEPADGQPLGAPQTSAEKAESEEVRDDDAA